MQTINIEQIMEEIRKEAAGKTPYEPAAEFGAVKDAVLANPVASGKVYRAMHKVKTNIKNFFQRIVCAVMAMYVFAKKQIGVNNNIILQNETNVNELSGYIYGALDQKLIALEQENQAMKAKIQQLEKEVRGRAE